MRIFSSNLNRKDDISSIQCDLHFYSCVSARLLNEMSKHFAPLLLPTIWFFSFDANFWKNKSLVSGFRWIKIASRKKFVCFFFLKSQPVANVVIKIFTQLKFSTVFTAFTPHNDDVTLQIFIDNLEWRKSKSNLDIHFSRPAIQNSKIKKLKSIPF
jgi:hypothetical protein